MPSGSHKNSGYGGHSGTSGGSHISGNHSGASNSKSRSYSSSTNSRDHSSHYSSISTSNTNNSGEFASAGQALTFFAICIGVVPTLMGIVMNIDGDSNSGMVWLIIGISVIVLPIIIRLTIYIIKKIVLKKRERKININKEK